MKSIILSAIFVLGFLASCDLDDHCDPGQVYSNFDCIPAPPDAAVLPPGTGGNSTPGDGGALTCQKYEGFGNTCTDVAQCPCGLDICNTYESANYCTHSGCLEDPTICPTGWTCLDLTALGMGSSCQRP